MVVRPNVHVARCGAEPYRPPILAIRHDLANILLQRLVVDALECGGIVEVLAEGVRDVGVLAEDVELERVGPPGALSDTIALKV